MTTLRAFTSALLLAAFVSGPAHAEMVSATRPSKTAEGGKAKHDGKSHGDKKKNASVEKKKPHDAKASKEKPKTHHVAVKPAHPPAKSEKKHAAAKPKPPHDARKDAHPDKRIASAGHDRQKERHGNH